MTCSGARAIDKLILNSDNKTRKFDISDELTVQCRFDPAARAQVRYKQWLCECVRLSLFVLVQVFCSEPLANAVSIHYLLAYYTQGMFSEAFAAADGLEACGFSTFEPGTFEIRYEVSEEWILLDTCVM